MVSDGLKHLIKTPADLTDEVFDFKNLDSDEQAYIIALLFYYNDFALKYQGKTRAYIESHYKEDIDALQEKLLKANEKQFEKMFETFKRKQLENDKNLPSSKYGKVNWKGFNKPSMSKKLTFEVVTQSIKDICSELKREIGLQLKVHEDINYKASDFSIKAKLDKGAKKLKKAGKFTAGRLRQKTERAYQDFQNKPQTLYKWQCSYNRNVPCAWCEYQQLQPPRPIDDWEYDHPNGHCTLVPVNGAEAYSDDYLAIAEFLDEED